MATRDYEELTKSLMHARKSLGEGIPEVMKGFGAMHAAANTDGALDKKTKELLAMAIAVAVRCPGCIGSHAKAAVRLGVTREEMLETLAVSVYMGGGPSVMYAAEALEAFDQFA